MNAKHMGQLQTIIGMHHEPRSMSTSRLSTPIQKINTTQSKIHSARLYFLGREQKVSLDNIKRKIVTIL